MSFCSFFPEVFPFLALQYENPWTIPNILSMARMGLAPVLGYLIVEENFNVALGVFVLAGVTDLVCRFGKALGTHWAHGDPVGVHWNRLRCRMETDKTDLVLDLLVSRNAVYILCGACCKESLQVPEGDLMLMEERGMSGLPDQPLWALATQCLCTCWSVK